MANRYWVGGAGTWNTTSTTNWSASSGGASGASVPTAADSVFFDQAGTYTVTCTGALTCLDFTVSAGTVTFADGTAPTFAIGGSMSLVAATIWNSFGQITFNATTTGQTVTTNGATINNARIVFSGVGGAWTLGSALSCSTLDIANGTFNSGNYAITCVNQLFSNYSNTRTINLGSSTISLGGGSVTINLSSITGLTFNAGTSQINLTNASGAVSTAGTIASPIVFYNVAFTSTAAGTRPVTGVNTFNNITVTAPSSAGVTTVTFAANQTVNGTLSTTGTAGNCRVFFASSTYGIGYTLTVNSAPSLTDADFRDLYVIGTAAPISGTRIGNRGNCTGITFSTPKTVYWNLAAGGNWSANAWATSSGGAVSTDNFPLPQDTATIVNTGLNTSATITLDSAIANIGGIDMSARTNAVTISIGVVTGVYGNWTNGSGVTLSTVNSITFLGGTTQTITSAGKTFPGGITVDTYGGTVQLADALNLGTNNLTVTNGTFTTAGFAVTCGLLSSNNSNVRSINLGASTVTLRSTLGFNTSTNLNFNAGTSNITVNAGGAIGFNAGAGFTFYNLLLGSGGSDTYSISGTNTFNNLTFQAPSTTGIFSCLFSNNQTINGTLTCAGASAVRRIFVQSDTIGTQRTLTVNSLSATDCDFRDIVIAGTAAGSSPTRAGDCGNNSGITFPSPKTVYWNLAGTQNWSATGWCTASGGTPDINQFPLPQDTAVFDDAGSAGTITINAAWNIGTFNASARTSAMTFNTSTNIPAVYGNWTFGTGVTSLSNSGAITFAKNGTQTITSNGVQFGCPITINNPNAYVQLADALSLNSARTLTLTRGTFDAVTYNVTTGLFANSSTSNTLKMGSGTWTLSGTGTVWSCSSAPTLIAGTSTIVLSDTSTTARTFAGGGLYYNKLTIGGTTGTSTTQIINANTFGELASTKTVAHTVDFGNNSQTFGKWSITGTAGNLVTISQPGTANVIAGPAVTGVDYLVMGAFALSATSPGEFYAGANSTGTGASPVFRTVAPAPRTLYWVGGTGNWSSTTKWATSSGGGSGAAIPTSLDAVNFDSLSNATAYTATIDAGVTIARCASFTMAGPLTGNVTFAGTVPIAYHGNVSFAATGITRTYTGAMNWAGNSSYTFTTNGLALNSATTINGIGSTWTLGSALNNGTTASITVTYGTFNTSASNYSVTLGSFLSAAGNVRSINLNGSTVTCNQISSATINFTNLSYSTTTSVLSCAGSTPTLSITGYGSINIGNVSFPTANNAPLISVSSSNAYLSVANLTFANPTTVGISSVTFSSTNAITVTGTLTLGVGLPSTRTFLQAITLGTPVTLNVNSIAAGASDVDFRDITITGAAAPISGTRFGDCKGNSGITFPAAKTVYYGQTGSNSWGVTGSGSWSLTSGGALDATAFPLAQDTAVFPAATYPASGSTTTINTSYNIGTIDMSARTSNTMTLATGTTTPTIYGSWTNGTGTTLSGTGAMTFAGRGSQTITSAGKTFTQDMVFSTPGGSITLLDAYTNNRLSGSAIQQNQGTFDANGYNVTLSSGGFFSNNSFSRTVAIGSGTWVLGTNGGAWTATTSTNLTVTGTGTISLTSASAKTFAGGSISYSGITLNQGGAGTLTISGNNTFANITNTYGATGATTISLANATQTVGAFTAAGTAGNLLTITGTSAASPATLIYSGGGVISGVDYVVPTFVRAYPTTTTWYAGANSTNGGSLGWIFTAPPSGAAATGSFLMFFQ